MIKRRQTGIGFGMTGIQASLAPRRTGIQGGGSGGGPTPPPSYVPAMKFNDARNSMYVGGISSLFT